MHNKTKTHTDVTQTMESTLNMFILNIIKMAMNLNLSQNLVSIVIGVTFILTAKNRVLYQNC